MFPSLQSWLNCEYGRSDGRTSEAKKVIEILPDSFGTLAHRTPYATRKAKQPMEGN